MDIKKFKIQVIPILKEAGVIRSELFGSMARGDNQAGSDLDLIVEMPTDTSLLAFAGLKNRLEESLGIDVDLVSYDAINPKLKPFIKKDAVQIL